jgi:hypothetical protein
MRIMLFVMVSQLNFLHMFGEYLKIFQKYEE